jgi:hypothetical protein
MTVVQAYAVVFDTDLLKQVETAAVRVAVAVASESASVDRHTERAELASRIANNPQGYGRVFAWAVISDDAFLALIPSQVSANYQLAQIQNRIAAVYNTYL